jgi:peroxiredoxin
MKKSKFLLILLLVAGIAYFMYLREGPGGAGVGEKAPSFMLPGRSTSVRLEDFKGKVVLLNFWATWCPPCVHEMPSLEALHQHMQGKNFEILAASVDEGGWTAIDRFLKAVPVTLTILLDARGDASGLYGVYQLPESYLIDQTGMIVRKYVGPRDWMDPALVAEIEGYVRGS